MVTQDETNHADVELAIPTCPYCDKPREEAGVNGMHPDCARQLAEDWDYYDTICHIWS